MKFCKDCKHLLGIICRNPKAEHERHPVNGDWPVAIEMRAYKHFDRSDMCGPHAQWFESKENPSKSYGVTRAL